MDRCPECHSDRVIPWADGYICCSCGCEFDSLALPEYELKNASESTCLDDVKIT